MATNIRDEPAAERVMGSATVADFIDDGQYALVRLSLTDGRSIDFYHRTDRLRDEAGRPLVIGAQVALLGNHSLPKTVMFGRRVLFTSDAWWAGPPPPPDGPGGAVSAATGSDGTSSAVGE